MKLKRALAVLLALVLAFGLALPAMAAEDEPEPCPYCAEDSTCPRMPVITQQPQSVRMDLFSDGFIPVSVEAYIPNDEWIGVRWYRGEQAVRSNSNIHNRFNVHVNTESGDYHAVVYNIFSPEHYVVSETFRVYNPTFLAIVRYWATNIFGLFAFFTFPIWFPILFWLFILLLTPIGFITNLFR